MKYDPKRALTRVLGGKSMADAASLRSWYLAVAGLLAAQGTILLLLSNPFLLPVYAAHLTSDTLQAHLSDTPVSAVALYELCRVNLAYLAAATLLVAALLAVLTATVWRNKMAQWVKAGQLPVRWAIFAVVMSGILVTLALLAGTRTWDMLGSMVVLTGLAGLAAYGFARVYSGRGKLSGDAVILLVVALVSGVLPWLEVLKTMIAANLFGNVFTSGAMWWLYGTSLLGVLLIAANVVMAYRRHGKWANAVYAEFWHLALLLIVASAFCWQLFAAVLHP